MLTSGRGFKVVITCEVHNVCVEMLSRVAEVVISEDFKIGGDNLIPYVRDADALILGAGLVNRKVIENAPKLKIIARCGVGYDNVDVSAATENGIWVTITPVDELSSTVADHAMALMLCLARNICIADRAARSGKGWFEVMGITLDGKTLGIIGLGRIGTKIAKRAKGFGMKLVYYDVIRKPELELELGAQYMVLHELLSKSDFVVLAVPLTKETYHMIGEEELKLMKRTAYIINIARGGLIDTKALIKALKEKWIAGAALDVTEPEPLPPDHELFDLPNVIITPHVGGASPEYVRSRSVLLAEQVLRALRGEEPQFAVNPEVKQRLRN